MCENKQKPEPRKRELRRRSSTDADTVSFREWTASNDSLKLQSYFCGFVHLTVTVTLQHITHNLKFFWGALFHVIITSQLFLRKVTVIVG